MKKQIIIVPNPGVPQTKKGDFFEQLMRLIFETQRYLIKQRVNFTGMEIDLIAKHKDRTEVIYIECKAKSNLIAGDIKNFHFNVQHREASYGYFLSSVEFEHQVAGLIEEMKRKNQYKNLFFWGPAKICELLESAHIIKPLEIKNIKTTITKSILAYTHFGIYYILILRKKVIPEQFCVYDATSLLPISSDNKIIKKLREITPEIESLKFISFPQKKGQITTYRLDETVAEVQESENWYDYLPASTEHFIGREDLRKRLFGFLEQVISKKTSRRIFYIEGKSGWGKSSLITDLRGRCKKKRFREKYYVLAVDARTASSGNFVALAFSKLIEKIKKENFLTKDFSYPKLDITSSFDILDSQTVQQVLQELEKQNKILIIVFDQFEDIFLKQTVFKTFHKFLIDVTNTKPNLVVGFSWKSEINIPIDNESYHLWQQAKEVTLCIRMREFNPSETNGVIKQLENSVQKPIGLVLKRRLIESSQGFPWLIKKLCIHTYRQMTSGKTIESLIEEELYCETLFKNDLEELSPDETKALKYIAQRSFDGNFFDATEVDDKIMSLTITTLINRRLIVKSGTKYNVYWDIFRDYLVTSKVPPIGESYILHQYITVCIDVYLLFRDRRKLSLKELKELHPRHPSEGTIDNILRELRSIGLIRKVEDSFQLSRHEIPVTEDGFKGYIHKKFERYTPYLKLHKIVARKIGIPDIILTLKDIFRGVSFSKSTWTTYAKYLISWFAFAELDIKGKLAGIISKSQRVDNRETFTPQGKPDEDIKLFCTIKDNAKIKDFEQVYRILYDLRSFGLVRYSGKIIYLTDTGKSILRHRKSDKINKLISQEALNTRKIKRATDYFTKNPTCTKKEFKKALPELADNIKSTAYKSQTYSKLYSWAEFIYNNQ